MFRSYLKIALRNIFRRKVYSLINVTGLAVGMACFILIFSYVQNELSYDSFHEKRTQIYRLMRYAKSEGSIIKRDSVPAPLAPALLNDFPGIKHALRMTGAGWIPVSYRDKTFVEKSFILADPSFFEVFTFPLVRGNPENALPDKYSVVITETIAEKYFGGEDPIGKTITYDNRIDLSITGIAENVSQNTELKFDFLAPFELINEITGFNLLDSWGAFNYRLYVLVREDFSVTEFEQKSIEFCQKYRRTEGSDHQSFYSLFLRPITKEHLQTNVVAFIYIFSAVAVIVLLLACINYMNLAVAQSSTREQEVGIRKVIGANRSQLMNQFLGESVFLSFISLPLAVSIVELLTPLYNGLLDLNLRMNYLQNWRILIILIVTALMVGIFSGSYPAFYASTIQPVHSLKSAFKLGPKRSVLRNFLVVSQFSMSIVLIVCTVFIHGQLNYLRKKDLGFNKDNLIEIILYDKNLKENYESFKAELLRNPKIIAASGNHFMGGGNNSIRWEGKKESDFMMMRYFEVDSDFLETFQIELVEGRNFQKGIQSDVKFSYLLNESAVKALGWESAVGKQFEVQMSGSEMGQVIGVVKDFHFHSLRSRLQPLALKMDTSFNVVSLRIAADDIPATLEFIRGKQKEFAPNAPFEYAFLDNSISDIYKPEEVMGKILGHFSFLALFIACLGLLGLISYSVVQKTREIGIRKVMGASVSAIVILLTRQFTKLVLVANIIAWPLAYFAVNRLLQFYAYGIPIALWVFFLVGILTFAIAVFTVSFQAFRAALANPADALRYE